MNSTRRGPRPGLITDLLYFRKDFIEKNPSGVLGIKNGISTRPRPAMPESQDESRNLGAAVPAGV